jgi:hypothetical protein
VVTIFLATDLSPADGERDEDEAIEIVCLPPADSMRRCRPSATLRR